MKTIRMLLAACCAALCSCSPATFEPCRQGYFSIAYDLDGWCAYDNAAFEFNDNTWCQSDNEILDVQFDPPYGEAPTPMVISSRAMQFGCDVVVDYLGDLPGAPPMEYVYHIGAQGDWSVITIQFSVAVYAYLTTPSYPFVDKKLQCTVGVAGWGQGLP